MKQSTAVHIVEDDAVMSAKLQNVLKQNFPELIVNGVSHQIKESIKTINQSKPDLLLMDIKLTDGDAFDILEKLRYDTCEVIFITAYSGYMAKAIESYAFHFLTKPLQEAKLVAAIKKYINKRERLYTKEKLNLLSQFLTQKGAKILLNVGHEHVLLKLSDIIYCQADGNYTLFHTRKNKKVVASKALKYYEEMLEFKGFFRASRSFLVNVEHIVSIYRKEELVLSNNMHVPVSIRNRARLSELISGLS